MRIAMLGATGRTGQLIATELLGRDHDLAVLVRDPSRLGPEMVQCRVVRGQSTDAAALGELVAGAEAVVSALGPSGRSDVDLHRRTAAALISAMDSAGTSRFVGISGSAVPTPEDGGGRGKALIAAAVRKLGGEISRDKAAEYQAFVASDLDWTLVRPPRLLDGPATGRIGHSTVAPAKWQVRRADLAHFVVEVTEAHLYSRQAPFVWGS